MHCPDHFCVPVVHLQETDSTSNYLHRLLKEKELQEFTTIVSDYQTGGKGQRGNSWESERGCNLLFSFVAYPHFLQARRQFFLSQLFSLAIKEELDAYADGFSIKWPNDIYWQEKKICGTLLENDLQGSRIEHCVAGIGINLNQKSFRSNAPNPVSLWQVTAEEYDIFAFLDNTMKRIVKYYKYFCQGNEVEIARRYKESLFRKDGFHRYKDDSGEFTAQIKDVLPEGFLVLTDDSGKERKYAFKEVQYLLNT